MLEILLRLSAELTPLFSWLVIFIAATVAAFVTYVGIALRAVLRAPDPEQRQILYQVLRDLLDLFRYGKQR